MSTRVTNKMLIEAILESSFKWQLNDFTHPSDEIKRVGREIFIIIETLLERLTDLKDNERRMLKLQMSIITTSLEIIELNLK